MKTCARNFLCYGMRTECGLPSSVEDPAQIAPHVARNPRGIAVQPDQGLLAYTNWDDDLDNHPHIGLAGMDGEDLVILVNDSIRWPNGLAFDMPSNRLFWGEAYFGVLESIR